MVSRLDAILYIFDNVRRIFGIEYRTRHDRIDYVIRKRFHFVHEQSESLAYVGAKNCSNCNLKTKRWLWHCVTVSLNRRGSIPHNVSSVRICSVRLRLKQTTASTSDEFHYFLFGCTINSTSYWIWHASQWVVPYGYCVTFDFTCASIVNN